MTKNDIVIVGGGIAGLTAALHLAKNGCGVTLIERNAYCGGLMNTFERHGFYFEGGARALVNAGLIKPLIEEFKLDVEILPNPITIIIEDKILRITGEDSINDYSRILRELYPESVKEIDRIVESIKKATDDMKVLYGVENPMFSRKIQLIPFAKWFLKFLRTMYRINRMKGPFERTLDRLSTNQSLKDIIGQHFFKGTPAFFALSYFAVYNDYIYPKGGVGQLTRKMCEKIAELGGKVILNTEISKVLADSHILIDSHGNEYKYDKLVWTADLKKLYCLTDLTGIHQKRLRRIEREKQRILSAKGAESVFSVYLAVNELPETFANISTGHMFYSPDKRGLGEIHRSELKTLLDGELTRKKLYEWLVKYCEHNTFEVSIPVLRDSNAAPPGKTGIIISMLFDYELTKRIYESGLYEELKKTVEDIVISIFSESLYPGLRNKVIFRFSASPLTIERRVNSSEGSIVGWSFEDELPVISNMFRIKDAVKTLIPDIFIAGKWVYSPAGGPTAIITGRLAAIECMKK